MVTGLLLLVRRALWDRLGGLDETYFMYSEDVDFCLRARRLGAVPWITPDAVVIHEGGASSASSADKLVLVLKGKMTLMAKHWGMRASVGRALLLAGVALRATLGVVGSRVGLGIDAGRLWTGAWRRREEWVEGY